jgi:hypothetical protein
MFDMLRYLNLNIRYPVDYVKICFNRDMKRKRVQNKN